MGLTFFKCRHIAKPWTLHAILFGHMFNIFSNDKSVIDAKTLQQILDETLAPKLQQIGLTKATNYSWHEQTLKEIRHGFSYTHLKGATGTFTWGVNLDFLPIIHRSKLEYHKSLKKYLHHLFEWTNEYSSSFTGGQMQNGITTHWGFKAAKKSIASLFDRYEHKIIKWFDTANSIENLVDIAERQVSFGKYYDIHFPRPKYVLAFLYAKTNRLDEAIKLFEAFDLFYFDNNDELKEQIRMKLLALTEKNGM